MDRKFLELTTVDVTDPFYKSKVEVKEETDDKFVVNDIFSGQSKTFLKVDDPAVESYVEIEDPTSVAQTEELFSYLEKESDDTQKTNQVQEQLRLEEQFGSYSALNREQNLFLIGQYVKHPKEMVVACSPNPNMDLESIEGHSLHLYPNSQARSDLYVPIIFGESVRHTPDVETEDIKDYTNSSYIDLITNSYNEYAKTDTIQMEVDDSSNYINPLIQLFHPTKFILKSDYEENNGVIRQSPPVPYLLYDVRATGAFTYGQLKIRTCMKQDPLSRNKIFDDVNIPIFASPLHIPLTTSTLENTKVMRLLKKKSKKSTLPLMVAPYSYSVIPSTSIRKIGLDTDLMKEEYERHYVTLSRSMDPHPNNPMDEYMYQNLYHGIDIDNFNPLVDTLIPFQYTPYESSYKEYLTMPYIPEPVLLNDRQKQVLEWALTTFPQYKPLVEQYKLTQTPQVWFEYLNELWSVSQISKGKFKEDSLDEIRSIFNYPKSFNLQLIKEDIVKKEQKLEEERKRAELNNTVCYGLSIRKLYLSMESFKEDAQEDVLYWDSNRDSLSSDLAYLRSNDPTIQDKTEDEIVSVLQKVIPILSPYEIKRRAHEIKQGNSKTPIRPGDLVMIRLLNATYIYQKTSDGWVSKTTNLDESEYCESSTKGYLSFDKDESSKCTFIDSKCVPSSVHMWLDLLTQLKKVKDTLHDLENIDTILEERKSKLLFILNRMMSYSRVLNSIQKTTLDNDSWTKLNSFDKTTKNSVFEIIDAYEKARSTPDFVQSWLNVESVLDRLTRFDEEVRAYVEPITRTPIACEHTTLCILAAKSSKERSGKYMTQLLTEYGNNDIVGQKTVCKLCGEEIGADIVSTSEGFGSDETPIQLRTVTDVAVNTDYLSLPKPAQIIYRMVLALRDNSGISIDETELVRGTKVWYNKFIVSTKVNKITDFLFHLSISSDSIRKMLLRELIKIRIGDYLKRPENRKYIEIRDRAKLTRNKMILKKKLAKEVQEFLQKSKEWAKADMSQIREEDIEVIKSYIDSVNAVSSELRYRLFSEINEYKNVANAVLILIYAIQSSNTLSNVGLASIPGLITLNRAKLYERDHANLMYYLIYIYAKKNRLREYQKSTLEQIVSKQNKEQFAEESIAKQISESLDHLTHILSEEQEKEEELIKQDRTFTPNQHPFSDAFQSSFSSDHPIQTILKEYESISEKAEQDPNSIAPNTWMNYEKKDADEMEQVLHKDTLAIDVIISRFPLEMPRLESMRESNDIPSVEHDIISFSSQYDLETGQPMRKLLLRSGGSMLDRKEFESLIESSIPSRLIAEYRDWIDNWIIAYQTYAGPLGSVIEYDLNSQVLVGTIIEQTKQQLKNWQEEAGDNTESYRRRIIQYRNRIRALVGQNHSIQTIKSKVPNYELIPRMTSDLPDWYIRQQEFMSEQIDEDVKRLQNYLTQMNVGPKQQELAVTYMKKNNRLLYDLDFKQLMTSIYFEIYRNTKGDSIKTDTIRKLIHGISNGDELMDIQQKERFSDADWAHIIQIILSTYGQITEGVLETHKAAVLARQNRERKQRADRFTEEEGGLNRLYREFQLGKQYVSIDEMGIEQEVQTVDQQFIDADIIDEEEAMELMMGMGEDEGQYDDGEYDTL